MRIFVNYKKQKISKIERDQEIYFGDNNVDVVRVLVNTTSIPSDFYVSLGAKCSNNRDVYPRLSDTLTTSSLPTETIDDVTYTCYDFTLSQDNGWYLSEGLTNFFVWFNFVDTSANKCVGSARCNIIASGTYYQADNPVVNPNLRDYLDNTFENQDAKITDAIENQDANIALEISSYTSPNAYTSDEISNLTSNVGLIVNSTTGYLYKFDSSLSKYVSTNIKYQSATDTEFSASSQNPIANDVVTGVVNNLRKSTNLFDCNNIKKGYQITSTGALSAYSTTYVMNTHFNVTPGEKLIYFINSGQEAAINSDGFLAYYDSDGNFINKTRADSSQQGQQYTIVSKNITANYYRVLVRYYTVPDNAATAIWQGYTSQISLVNSICIQHSDDFDGNYQSYYDNVLNDYDMGKFKIPYRGSSTFSYNYLGNLGADDSFESSAIGVLLVAINSCSFNSEYCTNRIKIGTIFGHDSTLQILDDKAYCVTLLNANDTGDNPSAVNAYVALAVTDDATTISTSSTKTVYTVAAHNSSVGDLTITSGAGEPNGYFIGTNLYIIFSAKLSDNNWYELYRVFDTTTSTFGDIGICKLGENNLTCTNVAELVGISDPNTSISMNATITTDGTYYYAGLCLGNRISSSLIMYSSDLITWNLFMKPSDELLTAAVFENSLYYFNNYLYMACRQNDVGLFVARIDASTKVIKESMLVAADSSRPDFFSDGTNLYLAYTVRNRLLTQIMKISTDKLTKSAIVNQIYEDCVYPSCKFASDGQLIMTATSSNSTMPYFRRMSNIEPYTVQNLIRFIPQIMKHISNKD